MFNKVRKLDSSASPSPARAGFGPATAGIEYDVDEDALVVNPDGSLRYLRGSQLGTHWYVDGTDGVNTNSGKAWNIAFATVTKAHTEAAAGDTIHVAPGDYDEALVITKDNLTFIGYGARGAVAVAPSASNGIAITVDGSTASGRVEEVTLLNMGGEGNGTGGGLLLKSDLRRLRFSGCKFEGGAFAAKLDGVNAAVGDVRFRDCEFAFATTGLEFALSGSGDPSTQILVEDSLFHGITTDAVLTSADLAVKGFWLVRNVFAADEEGVEPTQYLDVDNTGIVGLVANNAFATTIWDTASFAIAAGVLFVGNFAQAEGPATGGGTSGRPD